MYHQFSNDLELLLQEFRHQPPAPHFFFETVPKKKKNIRVRQNRYPNTPFNKTENQMLDILKMQ